MKKRLLAILLIISVFGLSAFNFVFAADDEEDETQDTKGDVVINVYNWGQYIGIGEEETINVNEEFTKATGIGVHYTTFDSNETMLTKLQTGGTNYDIIIPSDYMIQRLIELNMLEKLDFNNIPNYKYIDNQFKNLIYDPNNEYSVPYTFGTVGIIYNKKYVKKEVDSWNIMWDPEYSGKILTFDNPRDLFAISESLLGYSLNTTDENEFNACYEKLLEQKPLIKQYVMDQIFDAMINESAWIAPYYAGDYLTMSMENENLAFAYPKEGFNFFVDAICIPKGAEHKAEAEAYINFLCNPEISGKNMDAIGYATPISDARQYLSEEFATSDVVYVDAETLERSEMFLNLSDEAFQSMNDYWSKLKIGETDYTKYIIIGAVIVAVIVIVTIARVRKKRLSNETYENK